MAEYDFLLSEKGLSRIINGGKVGVILNGGQDMLWIKRQHTVVSALQKNKRLVEPE